MIKEGETIARSTQDNLSQARRYIERRTKYEEKGLLTPERDRKIWLMEIKKLNADIQHSIKGVEQLVKGLKTLQKNCFKAHTELEKVFVLIRADL